MKRKSSKTVVSMPRGYEDVSEEKMGMPMRRGKRDLCNVESADSMKNSKSKRVVSHLKGDIKTFKKEASEDRELIKSLQSKKHEKRESKKHEMKEKAGKKGVDKFKKVMHEFKEKTLHSGSKKGPMVKKRSQALAIALSEARKR